MRKGLSATCVWEVDPENEEMARKLLAEQPPDVILDYLLDAQNDDQHFSQPVIAAKELED